MGKLTPQNIQQKLGVLRGWELAGEDAISKKYAWPSFLAAMKFANQVAGLAERADHHPDILISYRKVSLTLSTHSEGGLTEKDFELAGMIDRECQASSYSIAEVRACCTQAALRPTVVAAPGYNNKCELMQLAGRETRLKLLAGTAAPKVFQ